MEDAKFRCTDDSCDMFDMAAYDSGLDIDSVNEALKEKKERDDIDKHIMSAFILGVDITEMYSPARVNEVARRWD